MMTNIERVVEATRENNLGARHHNFPLLDRGTTASQARAIRENDPARWARVLEALASEARERLPWDKREALDRLYRSLEMNPSTSVGDARKWGGPLDEWIDAGLVARLSLRTGSPSGRRVMRPSDAFLLRYAVEREAVKHLRKNTFRVDDRRLRAIHAARLRQRIRRQWGEEGTYVFDYDPAVCPARPFEPLFQNLLPLLREWTEGMPIFNPFRMTKT